MNNEIIKVAGLSNEKIYDKNDASGFRIYTDKTKEFVKLEIQPGGFIELHSLPHPVEFYIIKGKGCMLSETEELVVNSGDLIIVRENLERGWRNDSDNLLEILVIKETGV